MRARLSRGPGAGVGPGSRAHSQEAAPRGGTGVRSTSGARQPTACRGPLWVVDRSGTVPELLVGRDLPAVRDSGLESPHWTQRRSGETCRALPSWGPLRQNAPSPGSWPRGPAGARGAGPLVRTGGTGVWCVRKRVCSVPARGGCVRGVGADRDDGVWCVSTVC